MAKKNLHRSWRGQQKNGYALGSSAVKVTSADGSVRYERPLDKDALAKVVKAGIKRAEQREYLWTARTGRKPRVEWSRKDH